MSALGKDFDGQAGDVGRGEAFVRACRFELRHLRGLRSTWILVAVVLVLCLLSGGRCLPVR